MSSDQPAAERPPVTPPAGSSPVEKRRAGKPATSLDAPHRRRERGRGPRPLEKTAIVAYRAGMGLMSRLPVTVARSIVSFLLQTSFFLVPRKRAYVNDNFAHVLARPASSLEVKRKALAAYRSYARYVVELMRLPRLSNDEAMALVDTNTLLPLEAF